MRTLQWKPSPQWLVGVWKDLTAAPADKLGLFPASLSLPLVSSLQLALACCFGCCIALNLSVKHIYDAAVITNEALAGLKRVSCNQKISETRPI